MAMQMVVTMARRSRQSADTSRWATRRSAYSRRARSRQGHGVGKGDLYYEPAGTRACPTKRYWDTPLYLRHTPELFRKVRDAYGYDHHLLHDGHHRMTPIEAARLGRDLEPFRLFWLEDATPAENQEAFRLIRSHTTTPLAVGEIFSSLWDCKDLIQNQLIDYIRATIIARRRHHPPAPDRRFRRAAPGTHRLPRCHRPVSGEHGGGRELRSVGAHFGIQEYMRHTEATDEVFPTTTAS